jgi:hypothetical protein
MMRRMKVTPATAAAARNDLLTRCKRDHVPIRRSFLQLTSTGGGAALLAEFVRARRESAFDLYNIFHASACGGDHDTRLHARVWARALNLPENKHSEALISRNWRWLEERQLIAKRRDRRVLNVTLLSEDGSGAAYTHPGKQGNYFKLPHAYWLEGWCDILDLSAKATLFILLSRRPGSDLPQERMPTWYGISADTVGRGLKTLREHGVLKARTVTKPAPLSPIGYTWDTRYTLTGPFTRRAPRRPAAAAPKKRGKKAAA